MEEQNLEVSVDPSSTSSFSSSVPAAATPLQIQVSSDYPRNDDNGFAQSRSYSPSKLDLLRAKNRYRRISGSKQFASAKLRLQLPSDIMDNTSTSASRTKANGSDTMHSNISTPPTVVLPQHKSSQHPDAGADAAIEFPSATKEQREDSSSSNRSASAELNTTNGSLTAPIDDEIELERKEGTERRSEREDVDFCGENDDDTRAHSTRTANLSKTLISAIESSPMSRETLEISYTEREELRKLQALCAGLQCKVNQLEESREDLLNKIDGLQEENQQCHDVIVELSRELGESNDREVQLHEKVRSLDIVNASLQEELLCYEETRDAILSTERVISEASYSALEMELGAAQEQLKVATDELAKYQEIAETSAGSTSLSTGAMEEELKEARNQLKAGIEQIEFFQAVAGSKQKQLETMSSNHVVAVEKLRQECDGHKARILKVIQERAAMEQRIDTLLTLISQLDMRAQDRQILQQTLDEVADIPKNYVATEAVARSSALQLEVEVLRDQLQIALNEAMHSKATIQSLERELAKRNQVYGTYSSISQEHAHKSCHSPISQLPEIQELQAQMLSIEEEATRRMEICQHLQRSLNVMITTERAMAAATSSALEQNIKELKTKLDSSASLRYSYRQRIADLESENLRRNGHISIQQNAIQALRIENVGLKSRVDAATARVQALECEMKEQGEVALSRQDMDEQLKRSLSSIIMAERGKYAMLEQEHQKLDTERDAAANRESSYKQQIVHLEREKSLYTGHILVHENVVQKLDTENLNLKAEIETANIKMHDLECELKRHQEDTLSRKKMDEQVKQSLRAMVATEREKYSILVEENTRLESCLKSTELKIQDLACELKKHEDEALSRKAMDEQLKSRLSSMVAAERTKYAELELNLQELTAQLDTAKSDESTYKRHIANLEVDYSLRTGELQKHVNTIQSLETEKSGLISCIESAKTKIQDLENELRNHDDQAQQRREMEEQLRRSWSSMIATERAMAEAKYGVFENRIQQLNNSLDFAESHKGSLKKQITLLDSENLSHIKEIKRISTNVQNLVAENEALKIRINSAEARIHDRECTMRKYEEAEQSRKEMDAQLRRGLNAMVATERSKHAELSQDIKELKSSLKAATSRESAYERQIAQLEQNSSLHTTKLMSQAKQIQKLESENATLASRHESARVEMHDLKCKLNQHEEEGQSRDEINGRLMRSSISMIRTERAMMAAMYATLEQELQGRSNALDEFASREIYFQQRITELENENIILTNETENQTTAMQNLMTENFALKQSIQSAENRIKNLDARLKKQVEELVHSKRSSGATIAGEKAKNASLERDIRALHLELHAAKDSEASFQQLFVDFEIESLLRNVDISVQLDHFEKLQVENENMKMRFQSATAKVSSLESELYLNEMKRNITQEQCTELEKVVNELRMGSDAARTRESSYQQRIEDLKSEILSRSVDLSVLADQNRQLNSDYEALNSHKNSADLKIQNLEIALRTQQKEAYTQKEEFEQMKIRLSAKAATEREKCAALERHMEELKAKLNAATDREVVHQQRLADLETEAVVCRTNLSVQVQDMEARNTALKSRIQDLESEIRDHEHMILSRNNMIDQLRRSSNAMVATERALSEAKYGTLQRAFQETNFALDEATTRVTSHNKFFETELEGCGFDTVLGAKLARISGNVGLEQHIETGYNTLAFASESKEKEVKFSNRKTEDLKKPGNMKLETEGDAMLQDHAGYEHPTSTSGSTAPSVRKKQGRNSEEGNARYQVKKLESENIRLKTKLLELSKAVSQLSDQLEKKVDSVERQHERLQDIYKAEADENQKSGNEILERTLRTSRVMMSTERALYEAQHGAMESRLNESQNKLSSLSSELEESRQKLKAAMNEIAAGKANNQILLCQLDVERNEKSQIQKSTNSQLEDMRLQLSQLQKCTNSQLEDMSLELSLNINKAASLEKELSAQLFEQSMSSAALQQKLQHNNAVLVATERAAAEAQVSALKSEIENLRHKLEHTVIRTSLQRNVVEAREMELRQHLNAVLAEKDKGEAALCSQIHDLHTVIAGLETRNDHLQHELHIAKTSQAVQKQILQSSRTMICTERSICEAQKMSLNNELKDLKEVLQSMSDVSESRQQELEDCRKQLRLERDQNVYFASEMTDLKACLERTEEEVGELVKVIMDLAEEAKFQETEVEHATRINNSLSSQLSKAMQLQDELTHQLSQQEKSNADIQERLQRNCMVMVSTERALAEARASVMKIEVDELKQNLERNRNEANLHIDHLEAQKIDLRQQLDQIQQESKSEQNALISQIHDMCSTISHLTRKSTFLQRDFDNQLNEQLESAQDVQRRMLRSSRVMTSTERAMFEAQHANQEMVLKDIETELQDSRKTAHSLRQDLDDCRTALRTEQNQKVLLAHETTDLNSRLKQTEDLVVGLLKLVEELDEKAHLQNTVLFQTEQMNAQLLVQLSEEKQLQEELSVQLSQRTEASEELFQKLKRSSEAIVLTERAMSEANKSALQIESQTLKQQLEWHRLESNLLRDTLEARESELRKQLDQVQEDANNTIEALTSQVHDMHRTVSMLKKKSYHLQQELDHQKEEQIESTRDLQNRIMRGSRAIISTERLMFEAQLSALEIEMNNLKMVLDAKASLAESCREKLDNCTTKLGLERYQVGVLESEVKTLSLRLEQMEGEVDQMKCQRDQDMVENRTLRSSNAILSTQLAESKLRNSLLISEVHTEADKVKKSQLEVEQYMEINDRYMEDLRCATNEKIRLGDQLVAVLSTVDALLNTNAELNEQIEYLESEEASLKEAHEVEVQSLKQQLSVVSKELSEENAHAVSLHLELEILKEAHGLLEQEASEKKGALRDITNSHQKLVTELSEAKKEEKRILKENNKLNGECRNLENQRDELQEKVDSLESERSSLASDNQRLAGQIRSDRSIAATQLSESRAQYTYLEQELNQIKEALEKEAKEHRRALKEIQEKSTALCEYQKENTLVKARCDEVQHELENLKTASRQEIWALRGELTKFQADLNEASRTAVNYSTEISLLQAELSSACKEKEDLAVQLELQTQVQSDSSQVQYLSEELSNCRCKLLEERRQLSTVSRELADSLSRESRARAELGVHSERLQQIAQHTEVWEQDFDTSSDEKTGQTTKFVWVRVEGDKGENDKQVLLANTRRCEDALVILQDELDDACCENADLQQHIGTLQVRIEELEACKSQQEEQASLMQKQCMALKESLESVRGVLEQMTESNQGLSAKIAELEGDLALARKNKLKMLAQHGSSEKKANRTIATMSSQMEETMAKNLKLEREVSELSATIAAMKDPKAEILHDGEDYRQLQEKYKECQEALSAVREELSSARVRDETLQTRLHDSNEQLQALVQSFKDQEKAWDNEMQQQKDALADQEFANNVLKSVISKLNLANDGLELKCKDLEEEINAYKISTANLQKELYERDEYQFYFPNTGRDHEVAEEKKCMPLADECKFLRRQKLGSVHDMATLEDKLEKIVKERDALLIREKQLLQRVEALVLANKRLGKDLHALESRASQKLDSVLARNKWLDGQLIESQRCLSELSMRRSEMSEMHAKEIESRKARESLLVKEVVALQVEVESFKRKR